MPEHTREAADALRTDGPLNARTPLAVGQQELARLIGLAPRTIRSLNSAGRIPRAIHLGRRRVWCVAEIQRWLEAGAPERTRWEAMRSGGAR